MCGLSSINAARAANICCEFVPFLLGASDGEPALFVIIPIGVADMVDIKAGVILIKPTAAFVAVRAVKHPLLDSSPVARSAALFCVTLFAVFFLF
jgi:hypothetical protein